MKNDKLIEKIYDEAKKNPQRLAFPEANDAKMLQAAYETAMGGYGFCVLVGNEAELRKLCKELQYDEEKFVFVDVEDCSYRDEIVERYLLLPDITLEKKALIRKMQDPVYFAMAMQSVGDVDVTIGGFDSTTADIIQAAMDVIGMEEDAETVSSVSICDIPNFDGPEGSFLALADIAVCPDPDASQLASIAISSCDTIRGLTGWTPRCAMLSFSTDGSASHDLVDKVLDALEIAKKRRPDLLIDGEFQGDVAIDPACAAKKISRQSEVAGNANILVFPDLNAGNISAKFLNKINHAQFFGVFLQGFKQICTDSSRTASVPELVRNIVFSAVRAAHKKEAEKAAK